MLLCTLLDTDGPYRGWGWQVFMLPYMDCSPIYNGIDFNSGLQYEYNSPDLSHQQPSYRCPNDAGSPTVSHAYVVRTDVYDGIVTAGMTDAVDTFHRTNYFGVVGYLQAEVGGIAHDASGEPPTSEPQLNAGSLGNSGTSFSMEHRYCDQRNFQGVFGQNSRIRIKDIKDGTSNVIIVGERHTPKATAAGSVGHGSWIGVPDCSTPEGLAMSLGDTSLKLNAGSRSRAQTTGFGSHHVGGAHLLLADGSVRFIGETINISTYRDLSTIDDERPIENF